MTRILVSTTAALLLSATAASAQTGTLDQDSAVPSGGTSAGFNWSAPSLVWQQQVRAGVAGQLEGVELFFQGNVGAHFDLRLRVGDGWNTSPVVWSIGYDLPASGNQSAFFDMTSAGVFLAVGDTFVWEVQGDDTGVNGLGSYIAPPGTPLYAEELYLGGPGCFADCGWRLAFKSYMLAGGGLGSSYCFGDGSGTACPCGNAGAPGAGCATSASSGAALLAGGTNSAGADDLTFTGSGMIMNQPALLFSADNQVNGGAGVVFGDGLRCAGGAVKRLGVQVPDAGGQASWGPGLGATGGWSAGETRRFQGWFRDPAGPCGFGFNLTQGVEIVFGA